MLTLLYSSGLSSLQQSKLDLWVQKKLSSLNESANPLGESKVDEEEEYVAPLAKPQVQQAQPVRALRSSSFHFESVVPKNSGSGSGGRTEEEKPLQNELVGIPLIDEPRVSRHTFLYFFLFVSLLITYCSNSSDS